ncbi:hypothetical protein Taro_040688, partial [Colocasia esculenta]|nr:hypothetical protein [Colocasia esculenta]
GCYRDTLPHRNRVAIAVPFPVAIDLQVGNGAGYLAAFSDQSFPRFWLARVCRGWSTALSRVRVCLVLARLVVGYKLASSWRTLEVRGKGGLDSSAKSFVELSWLVWDAKSRSYGEAEAGAKLASRGSGWVRGGSACGPLTLWRSEVAVLVSCVCHDLGWWSWCYIVLFRYFVVPYCRLTPLLPSHRGSSSWELNVGWVAEAAVASCVISSKESECCELLYLSELRVVLCKFSRSMGGDANFGVLGGGPGDWVITVGVRLPYKWSSPCEGRLQASPAAVLLVVFIAFGSVCVAMAERAYVWCGLHRCSVIVCGTGRSSLLLELRRCSICHVASLVEPYDTYLWLFVGLVLDGCELWLRCIAWLPCVLVGVGVMLAAVFSLKSELLTGDSRVPIGNCVLCRVLLATEWVADWAPDVQLDSLREPLDFQLVALCVFGGVVDATRRSWSLMQCVTLTRLGCQRLKALASDPFSLFFLPLSSPPPPMVLCLPPFPLCVSGEGEVRAHALGVVELAWSQEEVANLTISWVYLSTGVATVVHVAIPEEASARVAIAMLYPIVTGLLLRCHSSSRWYRDGLGGHNSTYVASSVSVVSVGVSACATGLACPYDLQVGNAVGYLTAFNDQSVPRFWLARACLGWPKALSRVCVCLVLARLVVGYKPAVRHGSCCACPAYSPGAFTATSVLVLEAMLADFGAEGGMRFGQQRRVICTALLDGLGCRGWLEFFPVQARAAAKLASRGSGWCVLLLAASGNGLVGVVVTVFPPNVSKVWGGSAYNDPLHTGTGNPYWALFARLTPLLPSARDSSSQELGVRWVAEAAVAPCVVRSRESECYELLYLNLWVAMRASGSLVGVLEVGSLHVLPN